MYKTMSKNSANLVFFFQNVFKPFTTCASHSPAYETDMSGWRALKARMQDGTGLIFPSAKFLIFLLSTQMEENNPANMTAATLTAM